MWPRLDAPASRLSRGSRRFSYIPLARRACMVQHYTKITLRSDVADRLSKIAKRHHRTRPKQIERWIDQEQARESAKTRHATNKPRR